MRARPGRLLPSVMVGGLLISGLALGAGVASGAEVGTGQCLVGPDLFNIKNAVLVTKSGDNCSYGGAVLTTVAGLTAGLLEPVQAPTTGTTNPGGGSDTSTGGAETDPDTPADNDTTSDAGAETDSGTTTGGGNTNTGTTSGASTKPVGSPLPLAGPPPAPGAPVGLVGAAGPVGALPPLAGVAPAGLAAGLFTANNYDPGLLFGSPLGDAASALFSPKADSAVTTVSQAQALAAPDGTGYGTPATIGVIILACLVGFAVRHRVITRMKARELPAAEYQPRHAAPELETEPETELQPAADEPRTLVVLTRR